MSTNQGWFESDDDHRNRIAREADERTIEKATESAPSQGWIENDDDYRQRIAQEANEHRIKDSDGSTPSQGWFENDDGYRQRIAQEANEHTIKDSTSSTPSQGWFESGDDYEIRIRKEANEHIVKIGTSSLPRQGWFEGDHDYRSRIAHEAREVRANDLSDSSTYSKPGLPSAADSSGGYSSSRSSSKSSGVRLVIAGIVLVFVVIGIASFFKDSNKSGVTSFSPSVAYVNTKQLNVRSGSGNQYDIISKLPLGTQVSIIQKATAVDGGAWVKIRLDFGEGWVNEKLLSSTNPTNVPLPVKNNANNINDLAKTNAASMPPQIPYEDHGACPFECCTYREWTTEKRTALHKDMNESASEVFSVNKGERVTGLTGVVITTQWGEAKVIRPTVIGGFNAKIGDVVYLLTYRGEGFYTLSYMGKIVNEIEDMDSLKR